MAPRSANLTRPFLPLARQLRACRNSTRADPTISLQDATASSSLIASGVQGPPGD